jgi:hypothetical protein
MKILMVVVFFDIFTIYATPACGILLSATTLAHPSPM